MMKSLPVSLTKKQRNSGWSWWAFQLLFLALILTEGNRLLGEPLSVVKLNFLFFCINFVVTTLILGRFLVDSCKQGFSRVLPTLRAAFLALAVYYLAKFLMAFAMVRFFPDYVNQNDGSIQNLLQQEPLLIQIGVILLVPVAEELMYRAVIFGSIHSRNRFLAYLVSSLLFALVHVLGYEQGPLFFILSLVQYLPAGLCLAWAYERSGSILAPILMHIAVNQMGIQFMR